MGFGNSPLYLHQFSIGEERLKDEFLESGLVVLQVHQPWVEMLA